MRQYSQYLSKSLHFITLSELFWAFFRQKKYFSAYLSQFQQSYSDVKYCINQYKLILFGQTYQYYQYFIPISMKNSGKPSPVQNTNDKDIYNSTSSKFIRKSNSQAFDSYQNMLRYKVNTEGADQTNDPSLKQPLEMKNTPSNSKPRSLQKAGTKAEEPPRRLPAIIPSQQPIQDMAMHMFTNIFMNSTTRYLKGYNGVSQNDVSKSKQKKQKTFLGKPMDESIHQNRHQTLTPKKYVNPGKNNIETVNSPTKSITSIVDYQAQIGKINRAGTNAVTSQAIISPRQNNYTQNSQVKPGQQNANIRPNQSKVEEAPSNMKPNQAQSKGNPRQQQNQQKSPLIQNSKGVVESTKAETKQTARVMNKQQNSKIDLVEEICVPKSPASRNLYRKPTVTQNTNKNTRITNVSGKTSYIQQSNNTSSASINNTQNYQNRLVALRSPKTFIPQNAIQTSSARNLTVVQPQKQIQKVKSETKIGLNVKGASTKAISSMNENQNKISTEQTNKIQINLVKSPVMAFVVAKWLMNYKRIGFSSIKAKKEQQIRYFQEAAILAHSTNTFCFNLQIKNYQTAFDHLKKIFVSGLKYKKDIIVKPEQTKERIAILLQKFLLGKIRQYFNILKIQSWYQSQSVSISTKKKKEAAKQQKRDRKDHMRSELSSLLYIVKAFRSQKIKYAFDRIHLKSVDAQSKNNVLTKSVGLVKKESGRTEKSAGRDHETQKKYLLSLNSNIASEISQIQYRISDSKRMVKRQTNKLINKIDELKLKNKKSSNDIEGKKKKNQLLKNRYQEENENIDLDLPDDQSLVTTLALIYADVFRSTEEIIDCQSLKKRHKLQIQDLSNITIQWNSLAKNIELKLELSLWQGSDKKEGKVRKAMKDQRKAEADLMKNYIRERYLWEWVHTASSKI